MTSIGKFFGLASLVCTAALSTSALAAPVTFLFGGQVTGSEISSAANVGDAFSGSLTFDTSTPPTNGINPAGRFYPGALQSFVANAGSYSGEGTTGSIFVNDNFTVSPFDRMQARASNISESVGVFTPVAFVLELIDADATVFSSLNLPLTPPNLADLTYAVVSMQFFDTIRSRFASITAQLDTLTAANGSGVPVPAASALLVAGLALIGLRRKK